MCVWFCGFFCVPISSASQSHLGNSTLFINPSSPSGTFITAFPLYPLKKSWFSEAMLCKNLLPIARKRCNREFVISSTKPNVISFSNFCNRYCSSLVATPILYADTDFCSFFGILHEASDTPENLLQVFSKNADKCGWMLKRGEWNTSFKRRWFVMSAGFLYYFASEKVCVFDACDFERHICLNVFALQSPLCKGMINVTECTITSGRDPDDGSPPSQLSFGIFHPVLREFQIQCDTAEQCEEWCKCLSLQDAKVKLDDFELLTVIGQVRT